MEPSKMENQASGAISSNERGAREQGVLLYYKYVDLLERREEVEAFYATRCRELNLRGRVRVARDGVNATLGGFKDCLEIHIEEVKNHTVLAGDDVDFKLARSDGPRNRLTTLESGFDKLSISLVDEVVTLGPRAVSRADPTVNSGVHLTPAEFHEELRRQANPRSSGHGSGDDLPRPLVLLDTRNAYETRIGRFDVPGVTTLDPQLRCFSDLPAWVDRHESLLRDKQVMMYCTGGVRCERASAYLRDKGPGFDDVGQLKGGIQRYLEAFPDGGFFDGKNFVFDERGVMSGSSKIVGRCLLCSSAWDDYGARDRCSKCRILILVCDTCRNEGLLTANMKCELCAADARTGGAVEGAEVRKLRILCLHGFRQTGKSFQGRTNALRRKLKGLAEFVFIDAPHELEFVVKHPPPDGDGNAQSCGSHPGKVDHTRVGDDVGALETSSDNVNVRTGGSNVTIELPAEGSRVGGGGDGPGNSAERGGGGCSDMVVFRPHRPKRAWLVSPATGERPPITSFDETQYSTQTDGWEESLERIRRAFDEQGPVDGVMGFSQGASVVGTLCALKQIGAIPENSFRFAILASGYLSSVGEHRALMESLGSIQVSSLHIFGSDRSVNDSNTCGGDRQISVDLSEALLRCFERSSARAVRHNQGHIIPHAKTYIAEYKAFLSQFL
ncbi:hypothetical protein BSKO_12023 [Bryopsis sp. KO-2023]|nr:hypothetical protein BSKO_12023 [Bryopsis sp. KO-2023]